MRKKIFLLAFLNLVGLVAVVIVFAAAQLNLHVRNLLFAPAHDRVVQLGRGLSMDLERTPRQSWNALMQRYSSTYRVNFYLFDNEGGQLAGTPVRLPEEVDRELKRRPGRPPPEEDAPPPPPPPGRGPPGDNVFEISADGLYWVGMRLPIEDRHGAMFLSAPSFYGTSLFFDYKPWLFGLAAMIAVFVLCWWPFIRSLTREIAGITRATERIAEGRFDQALPQTRNDELGHLSVAINRMSERLSGFVMGQKRFLGDIAHELCAPIARMQFGLGILEQRAEPAQQQAVADVQEEMRQMSGLVSELLSFSKAGMEISARPALPVDVAAIARTAISREASEVKIEGPESLWALGDENYLLRAISNLLRNAIRYAGDAEVHLSKEGDEVVVLVEDSGPGLPAEELERVFAPFYRLEPSRVRESGGAGLGLAIVKSCIEASGGTVRCRNRRPTGLAVEIRLRAA